MSFLWSEFARRLSRSLSRAERRQIRQRRQGATLQLETLETREVPSAVPLDKPDYIVLPNSGRATPFGPGGGPTGLTPAQISHAYGFDQLSFNGGAADGTGTTIAIVDAYSDPTITSDLHAFDKQFKLPDPVFKIVNETGGSKLPTPDPGWAGEISLDVEWVHAIAPGANILLVEATTAFPTDLYTAVGYAAKQPGVDVVSMSFGSGEFAGETGYDTTTFTPPASNPNVTFIASSGDSGAPVSYPAISPKVLAVGGTNLQYTTPAGGYVSESAWTGSGGGISTIEKQPSYQKGVVTQSKTMRTNPDVAYVADPNSGFSVYEVYGNSPVAPWIVVGGTSDAAPQWASIVAISDQGRALQGEAPLTNAILTPELYQLPKTDFRDITTGSSLGSPHEAAAKGYDLATGIGTPVVNVLIPTLVGNVKPTGFSISVPTSAVIGGSFDITVTAENSAGKTVIGYGGTVNFGSSDPLADLPSSYTFTQADAGVHTFTVTLNTAGIQTIAATDAADSTIAGTASVSVGAGDTFSITGFPSSETAGNSDNFTITALAPDGSTLTGYTGTVHFTSSDPNAVLPSDVTLTKGVGTFSATLLTAGTQSLTATDTVDPTFTGSESGITINPAAAAQLAFIQQPSNATVAFTIAPAVTVAEEDQYNNVITTDSSSDVSLSLSTSSTTTVLNGGTSVQLVNGIATFKTLSVSDVGTADTLGASIDSLPGATATSNTFNVTPNPILENFNNGLGLYHKVGGAVAKDVTTTAAAHTTTGTVGLSDAGDGNWYYRNDAAAQVNPGDSLSVWVQFKATADGRAYLGFGSTSSGTMSVVMAPNTGQFLIQSNAGYDTYVTLAGKNQTYLYNTWYKLDVDWGTSGAVVANLYGSNGTTLIDTIKANTNDTTPGGFSFRAIGSTKYFDTVVLTQGVNNFVVHPDSLNSTLAARDASVAKNSVPGSQGTFLALAPAIGSTPTTDAHATQNTGAQPALATQVTDAGILVPPLRQGVDTAHTVAIESLHVSGEPASESDAKL